MFRRDFSIHFTFSSLTIDIISASSHQVESIDGLSEGRTFPRWARLIEPKEATTVNYDTERWLRHDVDRMRVRRRMKREGKVFQAPSPFNLSNVPKNLVNALKLRMKSFSILTKEKRTFTRELAFSSQYHPSLTE